MVEEVSNSAFPAAALSHVLRIVMFARAQRWMVQKGQISFAQCQSNIGVNTNFEHKINYTGNSETN